jgi:hypothetical protein
MMKRNTNDILLARGYISPNALAERIGKPRITIDRWIEDGHLKTIRVAERVYISVASVIDYLSPEACEVFGLRLSKPASVAR